MANSAIVYTIKEVCEKLHANYKTVMKLIQTGRLKAINISTVPNGNKRWRIPANALDELMAEAA